MLKVSLHRGTPKTQHNLNLGAHFVGTLFERRLLFVAVIHEEGAPETLMSPRVSLYQEVEDRGSYWIRKEDHTLRTPAGIEFGPFDALTGLDNLRDTAQRILDRMSQQSTPIAEIAAESTN